MAEYRPQIPRQVAVALGVALLLRLAFSFLYWLDKPLTHDEREYLALAAAVEEGRGFVYTEPAEGTSARFGRAPGYPAFLALIGAGTRTAGSSPAVVKAAQAMLGALTVWLIAVSAARAVGARAGTVAAWIAAAYPPLIWISAYVLSESLYAVLAIGTALVLQSSLERSRVMGACVAGVLGGAAILVRPAMLFFLPLAIAWLLWRRAPRHAAALALGTLLVVTPWSVRNYIVYDRFVLVASEGGVTFWTGNHPLARGEGDLAANPELKRAELEFRRAHPGLSSEELEPLYYADAFANISSNPIWWMGLLGRKLFYTVVPTGPSYALHSFRYRTASRLSYLLLVPFAAVGAATLWRSAGRPTALLLLAASAVLVCIVFFPQERFRIPIIDPVLIVCAAALAGQPQLASSASHDQRR